MKMAKSGTPEHITKSWVEGGRMQQGYIVLVNVPGDNTYEVGLGALRKCLGLRRLTPEQTLILTANKPDCIAFTGSYSESSYLTMNSLNITQESAEVWADRVKGLL
jgi:hypothetical protein